MAARAKTAAAVTFIFAVLELSFFSCLEMSDFRKFDSNLRDSVLFGREFIAQVQTATTNERK